MLACPRICITAVCGGGGKTLLSLGLCALWRERGLAVKPFKKGPDYIDAAWLAAACGRSATNLDPFFQDAASMRALFQEKMLALPAQTRLALIEGNRGLYDGLNESGECSTAQVARAILCPVLLCLNSAKSTRTLAAVINGLASFEAGLHFAGVVLNRVGSQRHETSLRRAIEANTDLPVLGALPRLSWNPLPERHMGIASFGRQLNADIGNLLRAAAKTVQTHCDCDAILGKARQAPPLCALPPASAKERAAGPARPGPVIGVVRDAALWFYYEENLDALTGAGAHIIELSLADNSEHNARAWENIDGIYLGGGFPEDVAAEISASPHLRKLRDYAMAGLPIYAECGGLMVLCKGIDYRGHFHPMAGVFAAIARWSPRPRGLGYVEAEVCGRNPFFPLGMKIRGHEFHYSYLVWPDKPEATALALRRGAGICQAHVREAAEEWWEDAHGWGLAGHDGLVRNNVFAAYTHIFAPAVPEWAPAFVALARNGSAARDSRQMA